MKNVVAPGVAEVSAQRLEREQTVRFVRALHKAMVLSKLSQRDLAARLGVVIGTLTKYLSSEVAPFKVGLGIQARLAAELQVTLDSLVKYYETGRYLDAVTLDQVESWIRSQAGQETLPTLMASMQHASQRWAGVEPGEPPPSTQLEPYTWPVEELDSCNVSARAREKLGLTEDVMQRLVVDGDYDEELVDSFSIACNLDYDAVLEAFRERKPVT